MDAIILVVDDDEFLLELVTQSLERSGYKNIITATNGDDAIEKWKSSSPDLIILDIEMPSGMSGYTVLRHIRRTDKITPVIMLTSHNEMFDEQIAIERGANYWVTKSQRELLITYLTAALKDHHEDRMDFNNLRINFNSMTVEVRREDQWEPVHLTPRERQLLFFLARRKGKVQSERKLLEGVFDILGGLDDYSGMEDQKKVEEIFKEFKGLEKTISTLRAKIKIDCNTPGYIVTVRGEGYYFNSDN